MFLLIFQPKKRLACTHKDKQGEGSHKRVHKCFSMCTYVYSSSAHVVNLSLFTFQDISKQNLQFLGLRGPVAPFIPNCPQISLVGPFRVQQPEKYRKSKGLCKGPTESPRLVMDPWGSALVSSKSLDMFFDV